ncbi:rhodanese-like domain-containing protein [Muricauda sp. CAU 1633]|uniref:rhodanese-like domain-containing protein n=1 Tax=Allomuricauda sp. CAU 1633 TaxID=2816036 RepID=UPI001A8FBD45|nr:rhodanese-like domain-containing protein [Muricauda sp. CAU 1633]MBO0320687.1 rhodanese-like domain-containing protein [Muricauda sp. CAU 1633]
MQKIVRLALMSFALLWAFSCHTQQKPFVKKIDKATVQSEVIGKDVQLVDVRTPMEYNQGHIDDAVNFNINDEGFLNQIETLDKDKPVYLYCKIGGRSNRAAELLKSEGFTQIYDYTGGYDDWNSKD